MKKLLICALLVLPCGFANAQQNALKVEAVSPIPKFAEKRTPKNAKTWIFGTAPIGVNKSNVTIQFYEGRSKLTKKSEKAQTVGYRLNLFASANGKSRPKLLNSIRFSAKDILYFDHSTAQVLWLYPTTQRIPIIKLECRNWDFEGRNDNDVLLIFNKGLDAKPVIQIFRNWIRPMSDGELTYYDGLDEKKRLVIKRNYNSSSSPPDSSGTWTLWSWDGQNFSPPPGTKPIE